jgi:peroxiredoxin
LEIHALKKFSQTQKLVFPFLFLGLGVILIFGSIYFLLQNNPPPTDLAAIPVKVNYAAPELTLTDIQGKSFSLHDFRGQVVLVNLWATWCPPCKKEMPTLESFYRTYKDEGFTIVAVNDGDPAPDVLQFVKDYGLTFPVWLDPTYQGTDHAFKTVNLPSSYVINRDGTIVLSWVGGIDRKTLEKYVTPMIED